MSDQAADILRRHTRLQTELSLANLKLKEQQRKLDKFYAEVGGQIRRGDVTLLELALKDKLKAKMIARRTVVKTNLKDAHNRIEGILADHGRTHSDH